MRKRPTMITTIPKRPTTVEPFNHRGFSAVMNLAYKGIHEGPMIIYRTDDGLFHTMLSDEWDTNQVGTPVSMVTKTSRGMRIGPA